MHLNKKAIPKYNFETRERECVFVCVYEQRKSETQHGNQYDLSWRESHKSFKDTCSIFYIPNHLNYHLNIIVYFPNVFSLPCFFSRFDFVLFLHFISCSLNIKFDHWTDNWNGKTTTIRTEQNSRNKIEWKI